MEMEFQWLHRVKTDSRSRLVCHRSDIISVREQIKSLLVALA